MACWLKLKRANSGAAYVLALTTLLVGMTLALAMMRAGSAYFTAEELRDDKRTAMNLAEAGLDYGFWQCHYNGQRLPYSADVALTTGSFHVDVADDGNRDPSTMLITSTGTAGPHKYTMKRVTLGMLPYHYAWCENREINEHDRLIGTGSMGGMRANGRIHVDDWFSNITTGGWAQTVFDGVGTINPKYTNCPPIAFPTIDYNYYSSIATVVYSGDRIFTSLNSPGTRQVILVNGKVQIKGVYNGTFTIAATGDISVNGALVSANLDSYLALVTERNLRIESGVTSAEGVFYAHKADNNAKVEIHGVTTVTGCVAGDDVTTDSTISFARSPRLTLNAMRQLRLPGL